VALSVEDRGDRAGTGAGVSSSPHAADRR